MVKRDTCRRGHPRVPENLRNRKDGKIECRLCRNEVERLKRLARGQKPRTGKCKNGHDLSLPGAKYANGDCSICARVRESRHRRARGVAERKRATRCKRDHDLTKPENLRSNGNGCRLCHLEREHERRIENEAEHRLRAREYARNHREEALDRSARWRAANLEHARSVQAIRDAARRSGPWTEILRKDPCCYCGGPAGTLDHITPISAGGDNGWENLTAACHSCNAKKRTQPLLSFMLRTDR